MTLPWPSDWGQLQGGKGQEALRGEEWGRDSGLGIIKVLPYPTSLPHPSLSRLSENCKMSNLGGNNCAVRPRRNSDNS